MALTRSLRARFAVLILACRDLPVGHTAETAYGRCNVAQCKGLYFGGSAAAAMLSVLHTDVGHFIPRRVPHAPFRWFQPSFTPPSVVICLILPMEECYFLKLVCEIPR